MGLLKNNVEAMLEVLNLRPKVVTAAGKLVPTATSFLQLNNSSSAIAYTITKPKAGWFLVINQKDSGTAGHTVTLTSGTFDGSNSVATLNAQNETLVLFGVSATRFIIVENIGSVGLS